MKLTYSPQKGKPGHCMVAQVWADGLNAAEIVPTDDPAEATAMARMFAASPDLLAACERLDEIDCCDGCELNDFGYRILWDALNMARDALAKAKVM